MTVGIIGAMPSELVDIRNYLGEGIVEKKASYDYYINEVQGKKVINACSGIGKVNSSLCVQNMISNYNPDYIINAGIAGGVRSEIKICDIVVSNEVMYHDFIERLLDKYPPYNSHFKADEYLISKAVKACSDNGVNSFTGRIVSGDVFVTDSVLKNQIKENYQPYAVDMESAGVGHCAFLNKVPFVAIRCISDNADDEGEMSFDAFEKIAAKRVADIVMEIIKEL